MTGIVQLGGPGEARAIVDGLDVTPPAAGPRPWTEDQPLPSGGRRIRVKRACNGCGIAVGDATDAELEAAIFGEPLPDVRGECITCAPLLEVTC